MLYWLKCKEVAESGFRISRMAKRACNSPNLLLKCVSKVLGQMWALLALRGVSGLLRHILGTKMSSQIAFSTPKSIHIHKINSQIGLFNSPKK